MSRKQALKLYSELAQEYPHLQETEFKTISCIFLKSSRSNQKENKQQGSRFQEDQTTARPEPTTKTSSSNNKQQDEQGTNQEPNAVRKRAVRMADGPTGTSEENDKFSKTDKSGEESESQEEQEAQSPQMRY